MSQIENGRLSVENIIKLHNKYKQYGLITSFKFLFLELRRYTWRLLFQSYSQNKEDLVIDRLIKKNIGFYVDVGAYDPFRYSNTARFYNRGWSGINIEPDEIRIKKFIQLRERDVNLNVGVGLKKEIRYFYVFENGLINTFSPSEAKRYKQMGFKSNGKHSLTLISLKEIFETYLNKHKIDFLSIDTEGSELEVLKSNDWQKFRPKIICIETYYSFPDTPTPQAKKVIKYLENLNYIKYCDVGQNTIFLDRKENKIIKNA